MGDSTGLGSCPYSLIDYSSLIELITVIISSLLIISYSTVYGLTFLRRSHSIWSPKGFSTVNKSRRVLLAIAHPDDEAMFFGPTIVNLLKQGHSVYILCFSYGDAQGLGWIRKEELWRSCKVLGIPAENIMIIKHDKLQDNQDSKWPVLPITVHLRNFILSYGINVLITFDSKGVSGHLNHISLHTSVLDLMERSQVNVDCAVFCLQTYNFLQQYFFTILAIPSLYFNNLYVTVANGWEYKRIQVGWMILWKSRVELTAL